MTLENVFKEIELPNEKRASTIFNSLEDLFKIYKTLKEKTKYFNVLTPEESYKECFDYCVSAFQTVKINKQIINQFLEKLSEKITDKDALGLFISAMIQTSYNQGCNDFVFGGIEFNYFCAYLKGKPEDPIKIKCKDVIGNNVLEYSNNVKFVGKRIRCNEFMQNAYCVEANVKRIEGKNDKYPRTWGVMKNATKCKLKADLVMAETFMWWANECLARVNLADSKILCYAKNSKLFAQEIKFWASPMFDSSGCEIKAKKVEGYIDNLKCKSFIIKS